MKRIPPVAILAVLFFLPVPGLAQGDKPAATKPEAAAVQPEAKPAAVKVDSGRPNRSQLDVDARNCLELATNMDVHKCAEKYRYRGGKK